MNTDNLFELGYVQKIHGLKGEIVIFLDVDYPGDYSKMGSIFIDTDESLIPFSISSLSIQGNKARIKLEDVHDRSSAERLRSKKVYLPDDYLHKLEGDQFYYHEIIGFESLDFSNDSVIGIVKNVFEMPGDDLIAIDHNGSEVLVPLSDDIFVSLDRNKKTILLKLPEGLLEVFLSDQDED
ncbi:MAG: ribosome maturation factor RimM [Bacteroidota bacterium]